MSAFQPVRCLVSRNAQKQAMRVVLTSSNTGDVDGVSEGMTIPLAHAEAVERYIAAEKALREAPDGLETIGALANSACEALDALLTTWRPTP